MPADPPGDEEKVRTEKGEDDEPSLLELLLADGLPSPPPLASRIEGVILGRLASVDASDTVHVTFAGALRGGVAARAMTPLHEEDGGCEVALMFEGGDPQRPVVLGKIVSPLAAGGADAAADGRRVEIRAEQEIVLRCGEASITLTRAGKIILRGTYLLSRSSGTNRIQGGSVAIN